MAQTFATEISGVGGLPVVKPSATNAHFARPKRWRASVALASQVFGAGNEVILADIPAGYIFSYGIVTTDTSLGTSTISVGDSTSATKFSAAATLTAVNTPTLFGNAAAIITTPSPTAVDRVLLTVGVANLPASGNLVVDLYFSSPM